jgi:acetyl esterase
MATTDTRSGRHTGVRRVADLRLRGPGGATPVRVRWPHIADADAAPPLVVLLPDVAPANGVERADDDLAVELCTGVGAVVLCTPWAPQRAGALDRAEAALTWTADHGDELGADPARLAVAGRGAGAAGAAALALRARRRAWPSIRCQILVLTDAVWLRATGAEVVELNGIDAAATSLRKALSGRGEDR